MNSILVTITETLLSTSSVTQPANSLVGFIPWLQTPTKPFFFFFFVQDDIFGKASNKVLSAVCHGVF